MHPNPAFRTGEADLLARAEEIGLAHVIAATPAGPMVVHAPVTRHGGALRFHCARGNRMHAHLDGATVLVSLLGAGGYVSPNWYERPGNQVPTWNYRSVEIDGVARAVGDALLLEHLDRLADLHEPRPGPWTRDKTDPAAIAAMLRAITGFEIAINAMRGTDKFSQNKSPADRERVAAALGDQGKVELATLIRATLSR